LWRPVVSGIASLYEIETFWTISDLWDAHAALDTIEKGGGVFIEGVTFAGKKK